MAQPAERRLVTEAAMLSTDRRTALGVASITRGGVPSMDLNDVSGSAWAGSSVMYAENQYLNLPPGMGTNVPAGSVLEVVVTPFSSAEAQRITISNQQWWREKTAANVWGPWLQVATVQEAGAMSAAQAILDLAREDGWTAVYDLSNTNTRTVNSSGRFNAVSDGLGNLPDAVITSGTWARYVPGAFGPLSGFDTVSLLITPDQDLPQPITYMAVANPGGPASENARHLIGGDHTGFQHRVLLWPGDNRLTIAATAARAQIPVTNRDMVITATFDGDDSLARVNGQYSVRAGTGFGNAAARSVRIGVRSAQNPSRWEGVIGPVLIYQGALSAEKKARMENLLMSLAGIQPDPPPLYPGTRVFSVDGNDQETFVQGDPDAIHPSGIQSITKVINAMVARKYLTTNALLDQSVTVIEDDVVSTTLQAGDVISYRDLLYLAALPSDNSAPRVLARTLAETYIPGSKSPIQRYVDEMCGVLNELGYTNASVYNQGGIAHLSPRQVAGVLRAASKDSLLKGIFGSTSHTVQITGPNARSIEVTSTLVNPRWPIPGYVMGKSGTGSTRFHAVAMWQHPDGSEHITVVLDVSRDRYVSEERYREMAIARESVLSGRKHYDPSPSEASGPAVRSTLIRDITDVVGAVRGNSSGGVFLSRIGSTVTLTFAAVTLPASASWSGLMPPGFRPSQPFVYGTLTGDSGTARVQVSRSDGTVSVDNGDIGEVRGTIEWPVSAASAWPQAPYPGEFYLQ